MESIIQPQRDLPPTVARRKEAVWLYLIAVGALALGLIICIVAIAVLAFNDKQVPDILSGVAVGLVAALTALFSPAVQAAKE